MTAFREMSEFLSEHELPTLTPDKFFGIFLELRTKYIQLTQAIEQKLGVWGYQEACQL
jgi:hypothetical protein